MRKKRTRRIFLLVMIFAIGGSLPLAWSQTNPLRELYEEAVMAHRDRDYKKAIKNYEKIIELNPSFAPAYDGLGLVYRDTGAPLEDVIWYFKESITINPKYARAYDNLGKAYYGMGDFKNAERYCLRALKLDENLMSSKLSLGWIYLLGRSHPQKAIYYFNKALEQTQIPYAYYGLGLAYFMDGQRHMVLEAITNLRRIEEDKLAMQLEDIVRGGREYIPPQYANQPLVQPNQRREKSVLVSEWSQEEDTPQSNLPANAGATQVRLRGRLYNLENQASAPSPPPPPPAPSDGQPQISTPSTPIYSQPESSAAERIRELQRIRSGGAPSSSGSGGGGYSLPKGSGY